MSKLKKGYIQVYTGNGKGKTTAALGLALRAVGAGLKVYIIQFLKGLSYSEIKSLKKIRNIKVEQFGAKCFIGKKPAQTDFELAKKALLKVKKILLSKKYDVVILDEINVAIHFKLVSQKQVLVLLKNKPKNTELILTGRYAKKQIIKKADLVTEFKEVKHYYKKGILARKGIEF